MALDNGKDTRRPHSQEEADRRQSELEDRIVRDSGMSDKLMSRAMDRRDGDAPLRSSTAERVADIRKSATLNQPKQERVTTSTERPRRTVPGDPLRVDSRPQVRTLNDTSEVEHDIEFERKMRDKKKKAFRTRVIVMVIVEALTLACIFGFGSVYRYMNLTQDVEFDVSKVQNNNIDISQKQRMSGYWTVAVFGVDSRDGGVGKGTNADVQLIVNVDMATGDVILASVYRDTYLMTGKSSRFAKINEAYALGGPEQAVSALNSNLDLNIENYVTFNWKAVADVIDMLGGVDIDITDKEFYYMNAYIHETSVKADINAENPAANYISKAGYQHLNGVQAVAYARLRYMDNDFERTRRQREVISQCLDKAKKADLATLTSIIDAVLPQVAFNIDTADIVELAKGISRYNIKESVGFPKDIKDQMMGKKGDCVIPVTLVSNVKWLHSVLFGDEDYQVSSAVQTYSQKISDDSGYYANLKAEEATKKSTTAAADETDETTKKKSTVETDSNGYIISGTDEDGNNIYETDEDGNKVKASSKSKTKETSETDEGSETSEGETTEAETDEDGNVIETTTSEDSETTETTKSKSSKETTAEDSDDTTETTKSSSKETTASEDVDEPGLVDDDDDSAAGPSGSSTTTAADAGGPGSITSIDEVEVGPRSDTVVTDSSDTILDGPA